MPKTEDEDPENPSQFNGPIGGILLVSLGLTLLGTLLGAGILLVFERVYRALAFCAKSARKGKDARKSSAKPEHQD